MTLQTPKINNNNSPNNHLLLQLNRLRQSYNCRLIKSTTRQEKMIPTALSTRELRQSRARGPSTSTLRHPGSPRSREGICAISSRPRSWLINSHWCLRMIILASPISMQSSKTCPNKLSTKQCSTAWPTVSTTRSTGCRCRLRSCRERKRLAWTAQTSLTLWTGTDRRSLMV